MGGARPKTRLQDATFTIQTRSDQSASTPGGSSFPFSRTPGGPVRQISRVNSIDNDQFHTIQSNPSPPSSPLSPQPFNFKHTPILRPITKKNQLQQELDAEPIIPDRRRLPSSSPDFQTSNHMSSTGIEGQPPIYQSGKPLIDFRNGQLVVVGQPPRHNGIIPRPNETPFLRNSVSRQDSISSTDTTHDTVIVSSSSSLASGPVVRTQSAPASTGSVRSHGRSHSQGHSRSQTPDANNNGIVDPQTRRFWTAENGAKALKIVKKAGITLLKQSATAAIIAPIFTLIVYYVQKDLARRDGGAVVHGVPGMPSSGTIQDTADLFTTLSNYTLDVTKARVDITDRHVQENKNMLAALMRQLATIHNMMSGMPSPHTNATIGHRTGQALSNTQYMLNQIDTRRPVTGYDPDYQWKAELVHKQERSILGDTEIPSLRNLRTRLYTLQNQPLETIKPEEVYGIASDLQVLMTVQRTASFEIQDLISKIKFNNNETLARTFNSRFNQEVLDQSIRSGITPKIYKPQNISPSNRYKLDFLNDMKMDTDANQVDTFEQQQDDNFEQPAPTTNPTTPRNSYSYEENFNNTTTDDADTSSDIYQFT